MDEEAFRKNLRRKGKKQNVVDRNVLTMKKFTEFLDIKRNKKIVDVKSDDIESYVDIIELAKGSAKGFLYVLMNYFSFIEKGEMLDCARTLREERTKKSRRIFPIKEFQNIDQEQVKKLAIIGIKDVEQMLEAGKTKIQREQIAKQLNISEKVVLELVKLSDITRMGYVRTKLSRLYNDAGLDSPLKVAKFEPEELHEFFIKFVEESDWDGIVPNPKDLEYNIANARKLKKVVDE